MAEYTVEDYKNAARRAAADGKPDIARNFIARAQRLEAELAAQARAERPSQLEEAAGVALPALSRGFTETVDFMGQAPDALSRMLESGGLQVLKLLGMAPEDASLPPPEEQQSTLTGAMSELTGGYTERTAPADNPLAQYVETGMEFGGGALAMPIGGPLRSFASVMLPAFASETAGQVAQEYAPEYEGIARMAAALGIPVAQALATPALRRMAIGDPSEVRAYIPESERAQSVNLLQRLGIEDISAGQQLGSEQLMRLEGAMAPSLASQRQLTSAVAKEAGMDAQLLTSETLKKNRDRLGQVFDKADDAITLPPTTEEASRASLALDEALNSLEVRDFNAFPRLTGIGDAIINAAGNRKVLNPKEVSRIRADLRKEMDLSVKGINTNDQIRYELAHDLNEILDDMVMRSVTQADPDLAAQLSTARNQYRAHLTIERAMNRAGSDARAGILSPTALAGALRRREGTSFLRGTGTELAKIGAAAEEVLSPLPTVSAGGVRSGLLDKITSPIRSTAAATMQSTLPLQAGGTIPTELAKRVLRQTGGLLSVQ
jgi:hypothetical protein